MPRRPPRFCRLWIGILGAAVCLLPALTGCGGGDVDGDREAAALDHEFVGPTPTPTPVVWGKRVEGYRNRVNALFATEEGPLNPQDREAFTGLEYFPPDLAFRFVVTPDTRKAGQPVSIFDTEGNPRYYTVHSEIHLRMGDTPVTLTIYRPQDGDHLFLPFQDATTGKETYELGRYLELRPREDGTIQVDFNFAKNPYCAYSDRWSCPGVPPTNRLDVAVTAGEKIFHP